MTLKNSFRFGPGTRPHFIGDEQCRACRWDVPVPCSICDDGLVHIEFVADVRREPFVTLCDVCRAKNGGVPPRPPVAPKLD
jgi:hypothetical protein